jgi:eukaryotic-like serine/threonine-protein kinase
MSKQEPSRKNQRPWEHCWKTIAEIGGGGQGTTHKVESVIDGTFGCLKLLKNNVSMERRNRFRRECVAIETLDHPRIPKYIDSNSNRFRADDRLFLVTELIEGVTLTNAPRFAHDVALRLIVDLIKTMEYVHSRDVVHRDIKPDNIMLLKNDPACPVIVDFGLSFNKEPSESSTASHEQLGNRFLHLPELQIESGDRRNPVSDITQLVGVLLYLLTGHPPVVLMDDKGNMPHQRNRIRRELNNLPSNVIQPILEVFDRGFSQSISDRWQSGIQLRTRLESILNPSESTDAFNQVADVISRLRNSPERARRATAEIAFRQFKGVVDNLFSRVLSEFDGTPFGIGKSCSPQLHKLTHVEHRHITLREFPEAREKLSVSCSIIGTEMIVRAQVDWNGKQKEIGRVSANDPRDWTDVEVGLRLEILRVINEIILPKVKNL